MLKTKQFFTLIITLILLQACAPARPAAVTDLSITIEDGSVSLSTRRIIAGASIHLTIRNDTQADYTLWILAKPVPEKTKIIPDLIIHNVTVPGGQTIPGIFTSPRAAGEYPLVYSRSEDQVDFEFVKIVVVQPEYAR